MNKYKVYFWLSIVVVVLLSTWTYQISKSDLPKDLSKWQAVFLSDGQVYFGHISKENKGYYKLSEVYYLKYGSSIQQDKLGSSQINTNNLNLIKLGGEVHGPENSMYIKEDKIQFIENLSNNSQIVKIMESK